MSNLSDVMFSSASDEWPTPQYFYDNLNTEFGFTLDPCCTVESAKCKKFFTKEMDGLAQDWSNDIVWMNPPYGRSIGQWMQKAVFSWLQGATVVCLVPARTDTAWWHDYAMLGEIRFIRGRLKFGGHANSAPFPNAVIVYRKFT